MIKKNQEIGKRGEEIATDFLINLGYKLIARNYRFSHGEIDIIVKHNKTLVFAEVKTRTNKKFGEALFSIDLKKQNQIRKIAEGFIFEHGENLEFEEVRFDAILIHFENSIPKIQHIENAF